MFAAGAAVEGMDPVKLVAQDRKEYAEGKRRFSVSQVETVGFGPILAMKAGPRNGRSRASQPFRLFPVRIARAVLTVARSPSRGRVTGFALAM
jgi:hypothetical protein